MMTGIVERELQRTVWRRYRDTLCLVDASDPRFGAAGLAERVHEPSMRMLVLPADPERNLIAFDEEFWSRFMHGYQGPNLRDRCCVGERRKADVVSRLSC